MKKSEICMYDVTVTHTHTQQNLNPKSDEQIWRNWMSRQISPSKSRILIKVFSFDTWHCRIYDDHKLSNEYRMLSEEFHRLSDIYMVTVTRVILSNIQRILNFKTINYDNIPTSLLYKRRYVEIILFARTSFRKRIHNYFNCFCD